MAEHALVPYADSGDDSDPLPTGAAHGSYELGRAHCGAWAIAGCLLVTAAAVAALVVVLRSDSGGANDLITDIGVPCSARQVWFTANLTAWANVSVVVPLGNLSPPDHTFPTGHLYIHWPRTGFSGPAPVYAPGDLVVTSVTQHTYLAPSFRANTSDFSITAHVCNEVRLKLRHVSTLSGEFAALVGAFPAAGCSEQNTSLERVRNCELSDLRVSVAAGARLGTAGAWVAALDGPGSLDWRTSDARLAARFFVNAALHKYAASARCFTDYYDASTRALLQPKLCSAAVTPCRTVAPRCGRTDYDVAGTAAGAWVLPAATNEGFFDAQGLALVRDNADPSLLALSIGNLDTLNDGELHTMEALGSGTTRRAFRDVTANGVTYCYPLSGGNIALVRLISAEQLWFETQTGSACVGRLMSPTRVALRR